MVMSGLHSLITQKVSHMRSADQIVSPMAVEQAAELIPQADALIVAAGAGLGSDSIASLLKPSPQTGGIDGLR